MARSARFRQADIGRAIKAIEGAGKSVAAVEFLPEGGFRILIGDPAASADVVPNSWDEVLAPNSWHDAGAETRPRNKALMSRPS
jgi:hypothetical protein